MLTNNKQVEAEVKALFVKILSILIIKFFLMILMPHTLPPNIVLWQGGKNAFCRLERVVPSTDN